jgi:hypothetical protein
VCTGGIFLGFVGLPGTPGFFGFFHIQAPVFRGFFLWSIEFFGALKMTDDRLRHRCRSPR